MKNAPDKNNPPYQPPYGGTWVPLADIEALLGDPSLHAEDKKFLRGMRDFSRPLVKNGVPPREIANEWHRLTDVTITPHEALPTLPQADDDELNKRMFDSYTQDKALDEKVAETDKSGWSPQAWQAYNLSQRNAKPTARPEPRQKIGKRPTIDQIINPEEDDGQPRRRGRNGR